MKILVFGGRDYRDRGRVYTILDNQLEQFGDDLIIVHGDCPTGVDKFADEWAKRKEVDCLRVPAKWGKYDKVAGPMRNRQMAERYKPDAALQFPGNRGTAGMRKICDELKIPVTQYD